MNPGTGSAALRLDVVGAGPAFTDRPGASGAAYLVRHERTSILLDLGQGSFPRLASLLDPGTLDAIVVSHLHPDHFVDLVALRHYLRWGPGGPRRARVLGPAGLADRLDALNAEPGFASAALDVEELGGQGRRVGGLELDSARVAHAGESHAIRVGAAGRPGLVYSGDCGRADDLATLIRRGDTLLAEVSFGPGPVPSGAAHLDGPSVGALAARTGAARVLLTHLLMGFNRTETVSSVEQSFGGPVQLVAPGDRFSI
ncbi:MAG: MBL fold metallo-hydrolase [Chloroflexi bacterium]|nr:MBL fold metallo-hydrolase [Chloroflexota bacterium]